ncbi:hypothetical protein CW731_07985 [Polaribacter sp. ALD11]|nr:hypothetical protein CW731_07985 [Polaribacter sp. ALD11]
MTDSSDAMRDSSVIARRYCYSLLLHEIASCLAMTDASGTMTDSSGVMTGFSDAMAVLGFSFLHTAL